MNAHQRSIYCPLVEYYRSCLHKIETLPFELPGFGGGWRLYRNELGEGYQQDGTGFIAPRGLFEQVMRESKP